MKSVAIPAPVARSRATDFLALTKPRLNALVIVTTAVGYYLGSSAGVSLARFLHAVIGTACVAGGAAALNQVAERDVDALMWRTRSRPLPDGRVQPGEALLFGILLAAVGLVDLTLAVSPLAAAVALVTLVSYALLYTPLKRRTPAAMIVGAVPGALPPVIGWAAARGTLDAGAWALFTIVFVWQMPHFLAIAWLYREDFARAGLPLVPVIDPNGRSTARQVVLFAVALLPASLLPAAVGLGGPVYVWSASTLSLAFVVLAVRFAVRRTLTEARWLFFGSIVYLSLLWALLVGTRAFSAG